MLKVKGGWKGKDAVRIVFALDDKSFVVVKSFTGGAVASVKYWRGDLDKTASYWNMQPFDPTEPQIAAAKDEIVKTSRALAEALKERQGLAPSSRSSRKDDDDVNEVNRETGPAIANYMDRTSALRLKREQKPNPDPKQDEKSEGDKGEGDRSAGPGGKKKSESLDKRFGLSGRLPTGGGQ